MLTVPAPPADPAPTPETDELLSVTTVRDRSPGRVVVEVVGDVDAYTAPALAACLRSQSSCPAVRELVVDLRSVRSLGASGVRVLARADRRCRERGARLVILTGGRSAALRPLRSTGLTDRVAVDPPGADRPARRTRAQRRMTPRRPSARGARRVGR